MTVGLIILMAMLVFLVLMAIETPVALSLAASGMLGITLLRSFDLGMATLGNQPFVVTANYNLSIIPMYILLGMFALNGYLASRLFAIAATAFRRLPGGLGVATVGACAGFAAMTGSSLATAASIGRMSVGEMRRYGYSARLATGIVASAGTLGILIPPSVILAMYGVLSGESVAQLLVGGIVPGIMFAVLIAVTVILLSRREIQPALAQVPDLERELVLAGAEAGARTRSGRVGTGGPVGDGRMNRPVPMAAEPEAREVPTRWQQVRAVAWVTAIFVTILLGVFTGWFTIIESAAIGAVLGLVMLVVENLRGGMRTVLQKFGNAVRESAAVTSMALGLVVGAGVFTTFLVSARVPMSLTSWVTNLEVSPIMVVVLILAILIPLGMFLEGLSILIIVVPLVHPIVVELGFDGVWFAILFVIMLELGMITPPVGINSFIVSTATGVPLPTVFRGILPFVGTGLVLIVILVLLPDLVMWLPSMVIE